MSGLFGNLPIQPRPRDPRARPNTPAAPALQRTFSAPPDTVAKARALGEVVRQLQAWDRPFVRGMSLLAKAREPQFSAAQMRQIDRLALKYRRRISAAEISCAQNT